MRVQRISVVDFRNIKQETINLGEKINIFYGSNAQGKTNLLEAVYLCATGRSMRTNIESEMINFDKPSSSIKISFCDHDFDRIDTIDINLWRDQGKNIFVNNNQVGKLGDLFGKLPVVVFSPEDLKLIRANPAVRRKFMDTEICQVNKIYYYELKQYYKALRHRNAFLKNINRDYYNNLSQEHEQLFEIWDIELVNHGTKIINERRNFINKINQRTNVIYSRMTNSKESLNIIYKPNVTEQSFHEKLRGHRDYDVYLKSTSNGIHKDDLVFEINNRPAKIFGSQGQQKTAALSLKLAEVNLIHESIDKYPVLLLDDVLSELDESRQTFLMDCIKDLQVLVTSSETINSLKKNFADAKFFLVDSGHFLFLSS